MTKGSVRLFLRRISTVSVIRPQPNGPEETLAGSIAWNIQCSHGRMVGPAHEYHYIVIEDNNLGIKADIIQHVVLRNEGLNNIFKCFRFWWFVWNQLVNCICTNGHSKIMQPYVILKGNILCKHSTIKRKRKKRSESSSCDLYQFRSSPITITTHWSAE